MPNNPNFHNKGGRPIFNHVYKDDDLLCYENEKSIALVGYFAMSPLAESTQIDELGISPSVILKINNKRILVEANNAYRRFYVGEVDENNNIIPNNCYNVEFYLRHTIDYLIIEATKLVTELAGIENDSILWTYYKK